MSEQEYGTIRIPKEAYEHHNEQRKELGLTWEQYIDRESVTVNDPVDYAEIENRMRSVLEEARH